MENKNSNFMFVILIALLTFGAYMFFKEDSQARPSTTVVSDTAESTETTDKTGERNCLENEVAGELTEDFLTGKVFINYERSGEQGTFNENGIVLTSWVNEDGEEYTDNEAIWGVLDGELSVKHSNLTNGVFEDFKFYEFEGEVFAVPAGDTWKMFVGPSYESVEHFFNAKYMKEICR